MSRSGALLIILAVTVTVVLSSPTAALAQPAASTPTSLQLSTAPRLDERNREIKGWVLLKAQLTTADGKPVSNRPIDFYQQVELFGPREAHLGSAITDSTGVASLLFQAAQPGSHTVKLVFAGAAGYAASTGGSAFEVSAVSPPFETEPLPLAAVRRWLPIVLGAVVLAAWLVLLAVFLNTTLGIRTAARRARQPQATSGPLVPGVEART